MKVYTRRGDDGTTALRTGERVAKDDVQIELVGALDESQALLGLARAECGDSELGEVLAALERDLWILMAEATTGVEKRSGLTPKVTAIDESMVAALETTIDAVMAEEEFPTEFSLPGENRLSATLDVARTVVRRAERIAVRGALLSPIARAYLNRLSDLCWALARSVEVEHRTNRHDRSAGR
jgi:cob(I)alamin adenosyltransferase